MSGKAISMDDQWNENKTFHTYKSSFNELIYSIVILPTTDTQVILLLFCKRVTKGETIPNLQNGSN